MDLYIVKKVMTNINEEKILELYVDKNLSIHKIAIELNSSCKEIKNCLYKHNLILKSNSFGLEEFIRQAREVHGDKYDYSNIDEIKNRHKNVKIVCKKCGKIFNQEPNSHLKGCGCECQKLLFSKGEFLVKEWLDNHKIRYELQKRFKDCKDKQSLPFDFYLPDHDVCIEFQGQQHFNINSLMARHRSKQKAQKALELQQKHDKIKELFCKENDLYLIQIIYDEIVDEVLNREYTIFIKRYNKKDINISEQKLPHLNGFFRRCSVETTKTRKCEVCGKEFEPKILSNGEYSPITVCSLECAERLRKKRSLLKWGYESANQSPEVKAKQKATNIERYGIENSGGSKKAQEKARQTNLERYGVENGAQSEEARQKISYAVSKYVFTLEIDKLLTCLYIDKNLPVEDIAMQLNISKARVIRRVSELHLHRSGSKLISKSKTKHNITKEKLKELYINQKLKYNQIAKILGSSETTVFRKLKKFGFLNSKK